MKKINELKKRDFFKLTEKSKKVFIYEGFRQVSKKYGATNAEDISDFREFPKGKLVFTEFEF